MDTRQEIARPLDDEAWRAFARSFTEKWKAARRAYEQAQATKADATSG
jgi:hypothetical protein